MKGISIIINNDYKVEETCGTNPLRIDTVYYIEVLYVNNETAEKNQDKFLPPSEEELEVAEMNGYALYNAGKKFDVLDVKVGFIKYRIWAKPNLKLPYELNENKDSW